MVIVVLMVMVVLMGTRVRMGMWVVPMMVLMMGPMRMFRAQVV